MSDISISLSIDSFIKERDLLTEKAELKERKEQKKKEDKKQRKYDFSSFPEIQTNLKFLSEKDIKKLAKKKNFIEKENNFQIEELSNILNQDIVTIIGKNDNMMIKIDEIKKRIIAINQRIQKNP